MTISDHSGLTQPAQAAQKSLTACQDSTIANGKKVSRATVIIPASIFRTKAPPEMAQSPERRYISKKSLVLVDRNGRYFHCDDHFALIKGRRIGAEKKSSAAITRAPVADCRTMAASSASMQAGSSDAGYQALATGKQLPHRRIPQKRNRRRDILSADISGQT